MNITWNYEPALWMGAITAIIDLLIAFAVPISQDQKTAILAVSAAILAIVGSVIVRQNVTPTAKLQGPGGPNA